MSGWSWGLGSNIGITATVPVSAHVVSSFSGLLPTTPFWSFHQGWPSILWWLPSMLALWRGPTHAGPWGNMSFLLVNDDDLCLRSLLHPVLCVSIVSQVSAGCGASSHLVPITTALTIATDTVIGTLSSLSHLAGGGPWVLWSCCAWMEARSHLLGGNCHLPVCSRERRLSTKDLRFLLPLPDLTIRTKLLLPPFSFYGLFPAVRGHLCTYLLLLATW